MCAEGGVEMVTVSEVTLLYLASLAALVLGGSFGYPTIWVNRFNQPAEELGSHPDHMSGDLSGLLEFVIGGARLRPHQG